MTIPTQFNDWLLNHSGLALKRPDKLTSEHMPFMRRMMGSSISMAILERLRGGGDVAATVRITVREIVDLQQPAKIAVFRRDEALRAALVRSILREDLDDYIFLHLNHLNKYFQAFADVACPETKRLLEALSLK